MPILKSIHYFSLSLRKFAFYNKSAIEILFILFYSSEQIILIIFTFILTNPKEISLIVSVFAIVILTTFSLQKLIMESRIKILEKKLRRVKEEKLEMSLFIDEITKNLNKGRI
jgi:hypothetical protein